MGTTVLLQTGVRLQFDGELLEVVQVEATRLTLRDGRGRWRTIAMSEFLSSARTPHDSEDEPVPSFGVRLAALTAAARETVSTRAAHIRELLTGYRSGTSEAPGPGEPRPEYDPARPLMKRHAAKAQELGVGERTLRRWVAQYEGKGEAGLVDSRQVEGRRSKVDPRWGQACAVIMKRNVNNSTLTAGALLRQVNEHLDKQYGVELVPRPSQATAYRCLSNSMRHQAA